jgi:hypothetical protein
MTEGRISAKVKAEYDNRTTPCAHSTMEALTLISARMYSGVHLLMLSIRSRTRRMSTHLMSPSLL